MPKIRTVAGLRAELAAKEEQLAALLAQRRTLAKQIEKIDRGIAALSGDRRRARRKATVKAPAARRRKIPKNTKPLAAYIAEVLAKARGGMRVKDVMPAVRAAGYKTSSKGFYGLVAAALQGDAFRRTGRGVYVLRTRKPKAKKAAEQATAEPAQ
jgi:hypothetical protein